ncbi:MAG: hypothetical protein ACYTDX_05435 [Planctomycetota bacterium]|jgi:hypothetical protein
MRRNALLLLPLLFLAACAAPSTGPDGVPGDFLLQVSSTGASNPHCDYDLTFLSGGSLDYRVSLRGPASSDRRGRVELGPDRVSQLWRAVQAAGIDDLPPHIGPHRDGAERGVVRWTVRYDGRERVVVADRAGSPELDLLLETVFWAAPPRIFRPIGSR